VSPPDFIVMEVRLATGSNMFEMAQSQDWRTCTHIHREKKRETAAPLGCHRLQEWV